MEHDFWHERWQQGQIGFHEPHPNDLLVNHWGRLGDDTRAEVLVPLCGKSLDMRWLAERGHRVVGSELSDIAVCDFFESVETPATLSKQSELSLYEGGRYRLWCGDFFALGPDQIPPARRFYDRAALIALPPDWRNRYAQQLLSLLAPAAGGLLITLQYDNEGQNGPPFSVPLATIEALFASSFDVEHLEHREATVKGRYVVQETVTLLTGFNNKM